MRKRIKGGFICRACGSQIILKNLTVPEPVKKPYVRVFGRLMQIQEGEMHNFVGFNIIWK